MKKGNKTTNSDFELYKRECEYWVKYFGLIDYRIAYKHNNDIEGALAYCAVNANKSDRVVQLCLCVDWCNDTVDRFNICKSAFHEVCELLLDKIHSNLPIDRSVDLVHELIRKFENSIFNDYYNKRYKNKKGESK